MNYPYPTRREFIRKSAQTAALLALPNFLYSAGPTHESPKLGVALLGLGNYATNQLAPSFAHTRHCRLAGIVTGSPEKADSWKKRYQIPDNNIYDYDNFDSIKDNPDIDVVYVVTPNALHLPFAARAARAGKHVICEKPMEISVGRCRQMIEACEKAGVKLQIGYRLQYDPFHQELKRLGTEQIYGKVKVIHSAFSFYGINSDNWRFTDPKLSGGGPLMDVGIYCIQGARYATGEEPMAITAQGYKSIPEKLPGMEETICWQMEFPGGAVANCTSSYVAHDNHIRVSAEKGAYGLYPAFTYGTLAGYVNDQSMGEHSHHQQAAQMDAFALNITQDTPVVASGEEGMRDMKYIEAIYEAARTGERVELPG
ncbi:MAG: Gfo/Idh/MocA family oxidoreductase [Lewinellaceae bacterium]|nr:Gfo/Idh/MocA family oxidoreductase [Lewinellaceae bacterium]